MAEARRRRWRWILGTLAVLVVAGAIFINAQLEPHRLADTVLGRAGKSLKLRITYQGTPEYAFRPEPRLVLPKLSVAALDAKLAFLTAERAEISLPWSTITGGEPVITRITLDAPVLRLPAMRRWLASRPPTPFKLPTLSRGLALSDGTIIDSAWTLRRLSLDLPRLKEGEAAKLEASAIFAAGKTALPFELTALAATPGLASPLDLQLTLKPTAAAKEPAPAPIAITMKGSYAWADPRFTLLADNFAMAASSPIPSLQGKGKFELAEQAALEFDAVLSRWPETWPTLPKALAEKGDKLPVQLRYRGNRDFSDPLSLVAARDGTELRASLRVTEVQAWLAAGPATPLPPLQGTLKTPALDFDGITLEGVEVEISEGGGAGAAP
jgi:uncharacterized protein involved in outer membrane biogenesis